MENRVSQAFTVPSKTVFDGLSESINGWVCWDKFGPAGVNSEFIYICNPSTRDLIKLPIAPPTWIFNSYHFGFDPCSQEFKVLNIQIPFSDSLGTNDELSFWIFTLGGNSWRRIHPALPSDFGHNEVCLFGQLGNCVCLNGALHWIWTYKTTKSILVFNLRDENFCLIRIPNIRMSLGGKNFVLLQVDGHLVVLCYKSNFLNYETKDAAVLDPAVWTLEDYQDEVWIKDTLSCPYKTWWQRQYATIPAAGKILLIGSPLAVAGPLRNHHLKVLCYDPKQRSILGFQLPKLYEWRDFHIDGAISYTESICHPFL
ncbi:unnamed protein product [Ilex paraguariensis]|uniref:F-box associated beta-propeller type 3 domain-containing protein n=1 Tax=Ilex paraguariensis TaxID=185542 RepID=A0ABC8SRQ6_9AQUA